MMAEGRYIAVEESALDDGRVPWLAAVHPASDESVREVMAQAAGTDDGRSEWTWLRLPNGDLMLGVFPRGETYFAVEVDAQFPGVAA